MLKSRLHLFRMTLGGVSLILLFQNCGKGFDVGTSLIKGNGLSSGSSTAPNSGLPGSPGSIGLGLKCVSSEPPKFNRRVWRLNGEQYINSLRAAFPGLPTTTVISNPFNDSSTGHFNNNSDGLRLGPILTQGLITSSEAFSKLAAPIATKSFPCLATTLTPDCASKVVNSLGVSLFRRPLLATEVADYSQFLISNSTQFGSDGLALLIQTLVISPHFLFRYEVGDPSTGLLNSYEKASLISYSAANTSPDAELMMAAQNNILETPDQIKKQFLRLAQKSGRFENTIDFMRQYLHYGDIGTKTKDTAVFPQFTPQLGQTLVKETDALIISLLKSGQATVKDLLSTKSVMISAETASVYGLDNIALPPAGQMALTTITDGSRAGILTQPSFLASMGAKNRTSPVHLGATIRNSLLCTEVPPPPLNVPSLDATSEVVYLTQRSRLAAHSAPACIGCHRYMDPIGLGFEGYDSMGKVRTMEGGSAVDTSGEVLLTKSPLDGKFSGGVELGNRMSESGVVHACYIRNSSLYITGSYDLSGGDCFIQSIQDTMGDQSKASMVEIFANIYAKFLTLPRSTGL